MHRFWGVALAALVAACASSGGAKSGPDAHATKAAPMPGATAAQAQGQAGGMSAAGICPMDVPDTQLAVADTADGASLTFTTGSGRTDELRSRVRAMAQMHEAHHATGAPAPASGAGATPGAAGSPAAPGAATATGPGAATAGTADPHAGMPHDAHHGMGGGMGGHAMPPPSRTQVEDVPNGARITATPNDPGDLAKLREAMRAHAQMMQQGGCGAMHGGMHGGS